MPAENEQGYDRRRGPRDRTLRVGDREREAVAAILRQQHVEGRLDTVEFQERLERCLAAKTYRELDQLTADFPSQETEQGRGARARAWPSWPLAPLPLAVIPLAVIAAIVLSGGHLFWLVFPVFFFLVARPLLWRSIGRHRGYGFRGCGPRSSTRTETPL
jgi:Domain of unknown function (DUF1707)